MKNSIFCLGLKKDKFLYFFSALDSARKSDQLSSQFVLQVKLFSTFFVTLNFIRKIIYLFFHLLEKLEKRARYLLEKLEKTRFNVGNFGNSLKLYFKK